MKSRAALASLLICCSLGAAANAQTSSGYAYAAPTQTGNDNAIYEVLARVEQLQSEVQQLRGLVEEQAQTIADLQRKQGNMYTDLDERLQSLANQSPNAAPVAPSQTAQTVPNSTATAGQSSTASANSQPAAVAATTEIPTAVAKPAQTEAVNATVSEKALYHTAYESLRNGHNAQAIAQFELFMKPYPAGEYADNAQYWLAEAFKINRDMDAARSAFTKVVSQYPNSSKVPDALLKLGYIEFDLQNMAKARDYLTRVTTSYPGTTAAHLAAKKLSQMPL